jgi:hypothetical protein
VADMQPLQLSFVAGSDLALRSRLDEEAPTRTFYLRHRCNNDYRVDFVLRNVDCSSVSSRTVITRRLNLSDFSKKCAYGTPELGAGLATGGYPGPLLARKPLQDFVLSSFTLPHAATTLASKGLGAANRLIVACETLKLRATSACASPLARLCMASRR